MSKSELRDKLKNLIRLQINSSLQLTFGILGPRPTEKTSADSIMKDLEALRVYHGVPEISIENIVTDVRTTKHVSAVRYSLKLKINKNADKFGQMPVKIDGSNKLIFA